VRQPDAEVRWPPAAEARATDHPHWEAKPNHTTQWYRRKRVFSITRNRVARQ
jgi:hypothetical protein